MKKVALVTGGASGIGLGISQALAREGFDLAICGRRNLDAVHAAVGSLQDLGAEVHYVSTDVSSPDDRAALMRSVKERYGRLHMLVNNAGVAPKERRNVLEMTEESFDRVLGINLRGPFFLTQAAASWMIEQKHEDAAFQGCIVTITSISSSVASPSRGEYCISKAGLSMASALWAVALAEFDIPAFEVRPGIIRSDMTAAVEEKYDRLIDEGLLLQPRWGTPDDVGKAVAMLARGDLAYATGQVVMVDGGFSVSRL